MSDRVEPADSEHDLDAEYRYPSDAEVMEIASRDDRIVFTIAVPCPDCDAALELTAPVEAVAESALSLPLDDAEDVYD